VNDKTRTRSAPGAAASAPLLDDNDPALFPKLTEAQVELLARHGEVRPTAAGEVLFAGGRQQTGQEPTPGRRSAER
jgi:hypothetical protein